MPKKSTKEEFIQKAIEIHGDKYNYDKVEYINSTTKVKIYCTKCEEYFEQTPHSHLSGNGCPVCGGTLKHTKETFIKKAIEIHGDKYNYDKVDFLDSTTKVKIYCKRCEEYFEQIPQIHISKNGCNLCAGNLKYTKVTFIKKAIEIHGDKYNYDKVEYINNSTKVKIYCKRCEEYFEQIPHSHLSENGCPICGNSLKLTKETFIKKAIEIHGDKYNYDKVEYINSKSNILIYCNTHKKYFEQTPTNHLNKKGCSICGNTERRLKSIKRIEENKLNGNQLYPGFNKNACKLFYEISLNENIHIQHAMNGGEYHIKELGYWVDGYDNVNNVVYEFDEKYHNKEKQQEKDKIRQQEIENFLGCTFIRIKEN